MGLPGRVGGTLLLRPSEGCPLLPSWKSSVFGRQETLSVGELDTFALDFAVANDIPEQAFRSCYLQGDSVTKVLADLSEGFAVRVRSTPTYFVDGSPDLLVRRPPDGGVPPEDLPQGGGPSARRAGVAEGPPAPRPAAKK